MDTLVVRDGCGEGVGVSEMAVARDCCVEGVRAIFIFRITVAIIVAVPKTPT